MVPFSERRAPDLRSGISLSVCGPKGTRFIQQQEA